jgi:hypothetical protein
MSLLNYNDKTIRRIDVDSLDRVIIYFTDDSKLKLGSDPNWEKIRWYTDEPKNIQIK